MLSGGRQRTDGLLGDHGLNRGLSLDEPAPTDLGAQHLDCVAVIGVGLIPAQWFPGAVEPPDEDDGREPPSSGR